LLQTECPSWLYPVTQGATTIWERWDSLLPDGRVNPSGMTSFNHYALGAVADWLHRTVAGLAPADPGYRRLRIAPQPGGGLTSASARLLTPYGQASVSWTFADDELEVSALIPPNTSAEVALPGQDTLAVASGRHQWRITMPSGENAKQPITLDSTIGELMDDPALMQLFKDTLVKYFPEAAAYMDGADASASGVTIRSVGAMVPNGEAFLAELERELA
jgi:alpha-L-rhamnosidase